MFSLMLLRSVFSGPEGRTTQWEVGFKGSPLFRKPRDNGVRRKRSAGPTVLRQAGQQTASTGRRGGLERESNKHEVGKMP